MPAGHSLALELHFVGSRLLIVEPVQQIVAWYKPTHHKPILKRPIQGRLNTGWGSWIRTNTDGVRGQWSELFYPTVCTGFLRFFNFRQTD